VSDSGSKLIYVLNPSNAALAQSFPVLPQSTSGGSQTPAPAALAVTNSGVVYFATAGAAPLTVFHKLDSTTGITTDFSGFLGLASGVSSVVLLSPDGGLVYTNVCSNCSINTSSDQVTGGLPNYGSANLALSNDGSTLANDKFMFYETASTLHPTAFLYYYSATRLSGQPVLPASIGVPSSYEIYGQKVSYTSNRVLPRTDSLDAGSYRLQLPFNLATPNPGANPPFVAPIDALVSTNPWGVFLVILPTGGVAQVDLSGLAP
jgi:hypothetical protein